jgi:hypothetical protein
MTLPDFYLSFIHFPFKNQVPLKRVDTQVWTTNVPQMHAIDADWLAIGYNVQRYQKLDSDTGTRHA